MRSRITGITGADSRLSTGARRSGRIITLRKLPEDGYDRLWIRLVMQFVVQVQMV
jgi:hypothetical protein